MEKPQRPCATCGTHGAPQKCPCTTVNYCGPECQKSNWEQHKEDCSVFLTNDLKKTKTEHGKESVEVIVAQYNLAITLCKCEQYRKADKLLLKCLEMCDFHHLEISPIFQLKELVFLIIKQLAGNYFQQDQFQSSKNMYIRALKMTKTLHGKQNKKVSEIKLILARIAAMDKLDGGDIDATKKTLQACAVEDHIGIIGHNINLCSSYYNTDKLELAMQTGTNALELARKHDCVAEVAECLTILASVLLQQGKWEEALHHLEEALPTLRVKYGEKSISVADALFNLAQIYAHKGKKHEALKLYEKVLRYVRRNGSTHRHMALYVKALFGMYFELDEFTQVHKLLKEDEAFFRKFIPRYDELVLSANTLARCHA